MRVFRTVSLVFVVAGAAGVAGVALARSSAPADPRAEAAARGDAWAMAGRCDEAVGWYRKALGPGDARVRARLAECLLSGKGGGTDPVAEAQAVLDEGLKASRDPELLLAGGDVALRNKNLARALELYGELEKVPARRREARRARLEAIAQLAGGDAAVTRNGVELARMIVADAGESAPARARAEELLVGLRFGAAGMDLLAARRKLAEGEVAAAVAQLEPFVKAHPEIEEAHYFLAVAYLTPGVGRRKDALAELRRAPKIKEAQLELGVDALETGDLDAAADALKAAIALDERFQAAYYHLGLVERERGHMAEAQRAFQRAIATGSDTPLGKQASTKLQLLTGQVHALAEGQVIDAASEVALGQAIADKISIRFGATTDTALQSRLEAILHRLAAVADRPERELRYRVQLVEAPIPNALTLPGGTILVFRGLADMVKKELGDRDDAWAAILGHECAHAALRHGVGMMRMASSLTSGTAFEGGAADLAQLMNTISRAHEFEADQFGALYAYRAGFAPGEALRLHDAMLRTSGEIPRGMTHPTHAERQAGLRDYLIELRAKVRGFDLATKSLADGELDAAIVRLEVFLGVFPDSLSARSNLGVALHRKATAALAPSAELRRVTDVDPDSRARKIELRSTMKEEAPKLDRRVLESAVVEYRSALAVDPSYAPALTNLGAALFDLGDKKGARLALDRAVARAPKAAEPWINRATVLEAEGKLGDAQSDLRRALAIDEKNAVAWFDLALVSEKMGRKDEAKAAWDRYLALDGKSGWAEIARTHKAK
jgi:predicted Zn-dependent protease